MTISFAVEALSFRLGSSFGLLHGSGNLLAVLLEVPFLSLALLLETSGLVVGVKTGGSRVGGPELCV